ncbi:transcriptional regulator [Picrophilus oshimae DSM 9789]|uniref:Transcriptional regulator n=1 Tax=Picrophilus torridus (strain ATCC 700027 / DSM 9790 / JCM 10055 / NBRC 100828 / KAW 2/3) TaxID=1122961 RepID=Q6L065_PICTO|nr:transcriptional regulator [Picrophilus oshimae DSM 9789]
MNRAGEFKLNYQVLIENKKIDENTFRIYNKIMRRWTPLIIMNIGDGRSFNEIKKLLKINQTTLSEYLSSLENYNIIERVIIPSRPVHVKYRLTEKGKKLLELIYGLFDLMENDQ